MRRHLFASLILSFCAALLLAAPAFASPAESPRLITPDNDLMVTQYQVAQLQITGLPQASTQLSQSQSQITTWQVTQGTWNGQALAGLSLVLIAPPGDAQHRTLFISHVASPAQRDALLAALSAAYPDQFTPSTDTPTIQPALIQIDHSTAHTLILHIAVLA